MKQIILIGGGNRAREALWRYGEDVKFIYDSYITKDKLWDIPCIELEQLVKVGKQYRLIVTPMKLEPAFELCSLLQKYDLEYELYGDTNFFEYTMHIFGAYPNLKYDLMGAERDDFGNNFILENTMRIMFEECLGKYRDYYYEKRIDVYVYLSDIPQTFYKMLVIHKIKLGFAFCTCYPISERVIAVPDYRSCFDVENYPYPENYDACIRTASTKYRYQQAFWQGDDATAPDEIRRMLIWLANKNPESIIAKNFKYWFGRVGAKDTRYLTMLDMAEYKYLIDIRGNSWADRTKILLQLGRPVLMVDRIYKEWYFDDLIPMKHYVPIKPDLSDLIEKIKYLDSNKDVYESIVINAKQFCEEHFRPECYLKYLHDCLKTLVM